MAGFPTDQAGEKAALMDRRGGVQLWRQIADRIRQAISEGEYGPSEMMPSEASLSQRFSVNRHTVRAALSVLAREGIVQPIRGKGTMVLRRERLNYPITRRTRFSRGLAGQVERLTFSLRASGTVLATAELAEALHVELDATCVSLETLGSADGLPLSLASHVFLSKLEGMAEEFSRTGSITRALETLGIPDYVRLSTEVIARIASADEASALALAPGAIILETIAVNGLPEGIPFQFSRTRFPADRIKLSLHTPGE